jgi:hypothetical protein
MDWLRGLRARASFSPLIVGGSEFNPQQSKAAAIFAAEWFEQS